MDHSENRVFSRSTILVIAIICFSIILQIAAAYQKSLWGDEVFTVNYAQMDAVHLREALPPHQQPLYYDMVRFWGELAGFGKLPMRLLSVLFVAITLIFTYLLSKDIFGKPVAIISTAILGLSPLFLLHGHNVRYYSLIAALAVIMAFSSYRFWTKHQPLYLLPYVGAGALMLYILFTSLSFILGVIIWWIIIFIFDKKRRFDSLLFWIAAQGILILLWLPTYAQLEGFTQSYLGSSEVQNIVFEFGKRLVYSSYVFSLGGSLSPLNPVAWIGIEVILFILIFSLFLLRKSVMEWMPVFFTSWNLLGAVLLTFLSEEHSLTWQNLAHWFLYILPFLAIWLGAGLLALNKKIQVVLGVLLLVVYAVGITNYFLNRQFFQGVYAIPWEEIYDKIQEEADPQALVLCTSLESSCWYYGQLYGVNLSTPENMQGASIENVAEIWWIYSNLGNVEYENQELYQEYLEKIQSQFGESEVFHFIPQDSSIRWLKSRLFGHKDYEYQVDVFHFFSP